MFPAELQQLVGRYLPLDRNLMDVAMTCKAFYASLNDPIFARDHLAQALAANRTIVWSVVLKWLPLSYSCAALTFTECLSAWNPETRTVTASGLLLRVSVVLNRLPHFISSTGTATLLLIGAASGSSEVVDLLLACGNQSLLESVELVHGIPASALARLPTADFSLGSQGLFTLFLYIIMKTQERTALRLCHSLLQTGDSLILLVTALKNGRFDVLNLMLDDSRVDAAMENNLAISLASDMGLENITRRLLLHPKVDPSADRNFSIRAASCNGHANIVNLLLADSRVDPAAEDDEALREASKNGHLEVVKILLSDSRVNPSAVDDYALRLASRKGHASVVELLLADPRVDPSVEDFISLRSAVAEGHADVVKAFLECGRLDSRLISKHALISLVCQGEHLEVLKVLLTHGWVEISQAIASGQMDFTKVLHADDRLNLKELPGSQAVNRLE
ncbi:hypothetical protein HDU82_005363 [Entophlyctis luteolus]|nr:hypothetical protein HDU82_005363 [Entophlyctis luteolus]